MHKILFSGGGSLGHITPSIAVWEQYVVTHPGSTCLFVCANRPDETELLESLELPYTTTSSPRLRWNFIYTFSKALVQNAITLRNFAPDVVLSKGGFISVPTCIMARLFGIPVIIHESDAVSGRANTVLRFLAQSVCYGMPRESYTGKQVFTGNPVRKAMYSGNRQAGLACTGLSGKKPVLLVTGGSQGSQALNEAIWNQLDELLQVFEIVHITGRGKSKAPVIQSSSDPVSEIPNSKFQIPGYYVTEFVTHELADLYAIADVALTRASASSMAEMMANGIAMLLCPLREVGHDHQQKNARSMQAAGLATVIQQINLEAQLLCILSSVQQKHVDKNSKLQIPNSKFPAEKIVEQIEQQIERANV